MDNPISTIEHLPKNQKIIVIGGAAGLGGLLVYRSHQKNLAAAQANAQGGDNTDQGNTGDGTSQDGTMDGSQDPNAIDPNTGMPYADETDGMVPYGTDPYSDLYDGGLGSSSGGYDPGIAGAGDLMFPGQSSTGTTGSETINVHVTGGGATKTDANKHHASSSKKRSGHKSASGHKKTTHSGHEGHHTSDTHHKTAAKGKTAKSGKDKKKRR